jgi:hypothetical protein
MLRVIAILLGVTLGPFLIVAGGIGAVNELGLQNQGKVIAATITNSRTTDQNDYEVQYAFHLSNGAAAYSAADSLGRRNLWVTLSGKPAANSVNVKYLPGNPWVNRLANPDSNPLESVLTGLGVGLLLTCVGVLLLVSGIRKWRKARPPKAASVRS